MLGAAEDAAATVPTGVFVGVAVGLGVAVGVGLTVGFGVGVAVAAALSCARTSPVGWAAVCRFTYALPFRIAFKAAVHVVAALVDWKFAWVRLPNIVLGPT